MALRGWATGMLIAAAALPSTGAMAQETYEGESAYSVWEQSRFHETDGDWVYARNRATAREQERRGFDDDYRERSTPRHAAYRERPERCSRGNVGTILGAIAGGLLGNVAIGQHGNHAAGTLGGAGAGALIGSAADRDCT